MGQDQAGMTSWRKRAGAVMCVVGVGLAGLSSLIPTVAGATNVSFARDYHPDGSNTFTAPPTVLDVECPNGIVGTPGSDPADKSLTAGANTAVNFEVGGTVHYTFFDNPREPEQTFKIQDCEVAYPSTKFQQSDFNSAGQLLTTSKKDLTTDATAVDGADMSGIFDSTQPNITFAWHVNNATAGQWVCNFARDINDQHGGTGNRKALPACFQVTAPDLAIAKTGPSDVNAGNNISYTVTATNTGTAPATNVVVSDPTPAGTTFVSVTQTGGPTATCTTPHVTCTIPSLDPGASAAFTIVDATSASAVDNSSVSNTASVSGDNISDDSNDHATWKTTVHTPDLKLTKSGPANFLANGDLSYSVTITNTGSGTASGVVLSDPTPTGTTFKSVTQDTGPTFDCSSATHVTCTIATLAGGASASFTIVDTASADTSSVTNTASVTADNVSSDDNDSASVTSTVTVATNPDLAITKDGPGMVDAGSDLTYTVTATNTGTAAASNVVVTDTVPTGTTFVSATGGSGCVQSSGTITCTTRTLAAGAHVTYTIVVKADATDADQSTITNTASVAGDNIGSDTNDTATVTTTVNSPDLSLTKANDPTGTVKVGDDITYTLTAINTGHATAHNVVVTDNVPMGTTFKSESGGCVGPSGSDNTISCSAATLPAGGTAVFTVVVTVNTSDTNGSTITNTASVKGNITEGVIIPTDDNDTASVINTVSNPPTGCTANCGGGTPAPLVTTTVAPTSTVAPTTTTVTPTTQAVVLPVVVTAPPTTVATRVLPEQVVRQPLPFTGSNVKMLMLIAGLSLVLGGLLVLSGREKGRTTP